VQQPDVAQVVEAYASADPAARCALLAPATPGPLPGRDGGWAVAVGAASVEQYAQGCDPVPGRWGRRMMHVSEPAPECAAGNPSERRLRLPERIDTDPESVERDLACLVLTIVELVRQLMERQALRRVDQGDLTDEQIERIGRTLMALDQRMSELRNHFGLAPEDLDIDLGPLGHLLSAD
jgi:hypothetical protein